ncbi:apical endosomal glycoprotein-like [Myripristis murdjan]|uniref:apical endosomal glycoprotein-like n=1 Tax=Myripristis murdjan TaxID=586833 RepID=UPI0011760616|nr:apical endosomal glycoprotein-like [Myripristis murdjan]
MFGATVGSLKMILKTTDPLSKTTVWQQSGNQGDEWQVVQTHVTLQKVHQVILEATVGGGAGDIALDDISFVSGPCPASDSAGTLGVGLAVGLTLTAAVVICVVLFMLNRKSCPMRKPNITNAEVDQNSVFDLYDCKIEGTQHGRESDFSFFNNLYNPSSHTDDMVMSDA